MVTRLQKLNRLCADQRSLRLRCDNPNFRYRKKAVVSRFWYLRSRGQTRTEAYLTQLTGLTNVKKLNVDARTVWIFEY